jgi:hypothetical protein
MAVNNNANFLTITLPQYLLKIKNKKSRYGLDHSISQNPASKQLCTIEQLVRIPSKVQPHDLNSGAQYPVSSRAVAAFLNVAEELLA